MSDLRLAKHRLEKISLDIRAVGLEKWRHHTEDGSIGTVRLADALADYSPSSKTWRNVVVQAQERLIGSKTWSPESIALRQATARHVANMDPTVAAALVEACQLLLDVSERPEIMSESGPQIVVQKLVRALTDAR